MIKIVTYPDILYDKSCKLLLVAPGGDLEQNLQSQVLSRINHPLQVYYAQLCDDIEKTRWFLNVFSTCDVAIVNIDNVKNTHIELIGYMLSFPKTYYLTKGTNMVYNMINPNQIYNLDFLEKIGIVEYEK